MVAARRWASGEREVGLLAARLLAGIDFGRDRCYVVANLKEIICRSNGNWLRRQCFADHQAAENRAYRAVQNARRGHWVARSADRAPLESHHLSDGALQVARERSSQPARASEARRPSPPSSG